MLGKSVWKMAHKLLRHQKKVAFIIDNETDALCELCLLDGAWQKRIEITKEMTEEKVHNLILDRLPISRNAKYELKRKSQGLKKVTFWIPEESEPEVQLLCNGMCDNPSLQVAMLRDRESGKYVSVNKL